MHVPDTFIDAVNNERAPLSEFAGKAVVALSGIGDPGSFEKTLANLKAGLSHIWRYPDHHRFTGEELAAIETTRNGLPVITTYKDFSRFPEGWARILKGGVFILSVKIIFRGDGHRILMDVLTRPTKADRQAKRDS